ncbi:MAG: HAMP domain-containing histidine kinase [Oscillochloris sp.]|nr:HAMP domain-containing histidine kinase [Oscillochloris sp.]
MKPWRQLRWQLVGVQMIVVVVGVVTLSLMANWLAQQSIAAELRPAFAQAISRALVVAAVAAGLVGSLVSLFLVGHLLRPLNGIARSSHRIAVGHYEERVTPPQIAELADLAASFNQMAEALQQVEQQRIALIGNVAHELRTPLSSLEAYLEGLIDGIVPDDPETRTAMQHELRRLRRLVNDLQTLSRVEAGQVELHPIPVDLAELAQNIVCQLRPQVIDAELELIVGGASPAPVLVDPDRAAQIVLNLVGNAIRYTPAGGQVRVTTAVQGDQVELRVADNGIGIPPEALPYLFERFYRVDHSRSRSSGGSGIGLTIARHLAWAMGGDISAASPGVGQGAVFTLTLPVYQKELSGA